MSEKSEPTTLSPLTSSVGGSPVKTSALREQEQASKESGADCGESSLESFASYDHDMSLWKTSQLSLLGGSVSFSETWPMGMMRSGIAYQRHRSVPRTLETGSSLWPTPTVKGNYNKKGLSAKSGDGLATVAGGPLNPTWVEWLMGFPLGWTDLDASGMQ